MFIRVMFFAALFACDQHSSTAADVNRPGLWHVTFTHLVDVGPPDYVREDPAPEYPPRDMTAPMIDPSGCTPGCACTFSTAWDDCVGDVSRTCKARGGFLETCAAAHTILDCSWVSFDSDQHGRGVCVLEDSTQMDEFGYVQLGRYGATMVRVRY
jgi:hypothetical protein